MDKRDFEKGDNYRDHGETEIDNSDEDVHETSFNTASEGYAERLELDTQGTSVDVDLPETGSQGHVRSNRQTPVPEYLERRANDALVRGQRPTDRSEDEAPPPSYEEVVKNEGEQQSEPKETDPIIQPVGGAEGHDADEGLSPTEIALIMKMREGRDSYLPERRTSYEEAVEMLSLEEKNSAGARVDQGDSSVYLDTVDTSQRNGERTSRPVSYVEEGTEEPRKGNRLAKFLGRQPTNRLILIGALVLAVIGLILFLGLFPASFVYLEYHQIALKQSKLTGVVQRDEVFYPGCYILGPDTQFVRFQGSVHNVVDEMSVFTVDTIPITMRYSAHYFLRPKEVGQLFTLFVHDYDPVFRKIITSSIRTLAGATFSVDNFRFNRTFVEREIHVMLRKRLGGDCCPDCCPSGCQSNVICSQCKQSGCSQGYHVDVRYFFLMGVTIPHEVFERYLRFTLLEIEKEKEYFLQEHAVTTKQTELLTRKIKNEANEILSKANAGSEKIAIIAEADKEQVVQKSYVEALQRMYTNLSVTNEDRKLSLMMVRALEEQADSLYAGYAFDKNTLTAP